MNVDSQIRTSAQSHSPSTQQKNASALAAVRDELLRLRVSKVRAPEGDEIHLGARALERLAREAAEGPCHQPSASAAA